MDLSILRHCKQGRQDCPGAIYYRNHEKEILDFNYPLKSVVFAQQLRAGLSVLKLRTYATNRPEHECVPECDLINWLGAAGRTAVGVRIAKGDHNLYRLPLGDANSEPGKLETVDLGNELRDGFEKVGKTALKDPQQGQPIIHPVSHALDATQGTFRSCGGTGVCQRNQGRCHPRRAGALGCICCRL